MQPTQGEDSYWKQRALAAERVIEFVDIEWLDESLLPSQPAEERRNVWQLCPKCFGDGNLARYNSPSTVGTDAALLCDVCNGNKIIATYYVSVDAEKQACEFAEWLGSHYVRIGNGNWAKWSEDIFYDFTTQQLYNQYLKIKQ